MCDDLSRHSANFQSKSPKKGEKVIKFERKGPRDKQWGCVSGGAQGGEKNH